ncbi:MAG: hypothetical protein KF688_10120 [Pirellulales bacterium]|nr:hypothetical protein [Pirellulales bacterium]
MIQIRDFAVFAEQLPTMNVASDPADNVILATAVAGGAEYLVTGDKRHLLALPSGQACAIVTVRQMLDVFDVK